MNRKLRIVHRLELQRNITLLLKAYQAEDTIFSLQRQAQLLGDEFKTAKSQQQQPPRGQLLLLP
jgi:hypothetical protein